MATKSAAKLARLVGVRLREARLGAGLSQEAFAEAGGVSRDAVARLEAGLRAARLDTLVRLAEAVELPLSELLASDEVKPRHGAVRVRIEHQLDELSEEGLKLVSSVIEATLAYERSRR